MSEPRNYYPLSAASSLMGRKVIKNVQNKNKGPYSHSPPHSCVLSLGKHRTFRIRVNYSLDTQHSFKI